MAGADPKLIVALEAQLTRFERSLKEAGVIADRRTSEIEKKFNKINPSFAGLTSGLNRALATVGVAVSAGFLKGLFEKAIGDMSRVVDIADRARVSTDFIQALGFAVEQAGGSMEDAGKAATKFNVALADTSKEGNDLLRLFKANGVAIRDDVTGNLISGEKAFEAWTRLIAGIKDPMLQLNKVAEVLGEKVGPKMMTSILEVGRVGLPTFIQKMREAGVVLEEGLVRTGDDVGDKWNEVSKKISNNWSKMVLEMIHGAGLVADAVAGIFRQDTSLKGLQARQAALEGELKAAQELNQTVQSMEPFDQVGPLSVSKTKELTAELVKVKEAIIAIQNAAQITGPIGPETGKSTIVPPSGPPAKPQAVKVSDFAREIQQLEEKLQLEQSELDTINQSTAARERARVTILLTNAAMQANKEAGLGVNVVTADQVDIIQNLAEKYATLATKVAAANSPLATFGREAADVNKNLQEAGVNALKGLEDAMIDIATQAKTAQEAIKAMVDAILADLLRLAIRMMITGPIASSLGGMFGAGMPSPFGRASGGSVMGGRPYIVGEHGPELLVPGTAGSIVPNSAMGRGGGGVHLQIINHGAKIEATEPKRNSDGSMSLTIMVDRMVAKNGSTPGTATNKMLRNHGAKMPLHRRG